MKKQKKNIPSANLHHSDLIILDLNYPSSIPNILTDNPELIKNTYNNEIKLETRIDTFPENLSPNVIKISGKDDLKAYDDYKHQEVLKTEANQKEQSQFQERSLQDDTYIHDVDDDNEDQHSKKKVQFYGKDHGHYDSHDQEGNYYLKTGHNQWLAYRLDDDFDNNQEIANPHQLKFSVKYFFISFIAHILYFFLFGPFIFILNKCFGKYLLINMAFTTTDINSTSLPQHMQYLMIIVLLILILLFNIGSYRLFEFVMFLLVIYFRIICISTKYGYMGKAYVHEFTRRKLRVEEIRNLFLLANWSQLKDDILEYELQTSIMKLDINYIGYYFKFLSWGNDHADSRKDCFTNELGTIHHHTVHGTDESSGLDNTIQEIKDQSPGGFLLEPQDQSKNPQVQIVSKSRVLQSHRLSLLNIKASPSQYRIIPMASFKPKIINKRIVSSHSNSELFSVNEANYATRDFTRGIIPRSIITDAEGEGEGVTVGAGAGEKEGERETKGVGIRAEEGEKEGALIKDVNNMSIMKDMNNDKTNHIIENKSLFNSRHDKIEMTRDKIWSYRYYQFSKRYLAKKIEYHGHDHEQNQKVHQNCGYKHKSGYKLARDIIKKSRILNTKKPAACAIFFSITRALMPFAYRSYYNIPLFGENAVQCILIVTTFMLNFMLYTLNFLLWSQGLIDLRKRKFCLEQLTNILHMNNEGSNNSYSMINIFDPVTLKSWGNLRHILCDFGSRFYANSAFTLAITCIVYIFIIFILAIQLLNILNLKFDILMIVVFIYETIIVIGLLFCYMFYGSKINQHFDIHKKILKHNKNIIVELDKLKYIYFERNLNDLNNALFIEGIKYLKMDLEHDKYPEKFQEKLELRFQSLMEIINNLMEELDINRDISPYQILGFTVNENLMKAIAFALMSLVGAVLQKQMGFI